MERAQPGDSIDQRLASLDPYMRWAGALSGNLRRFRNLGYDEEAARKLHEHAERLTKELYAANGRDMPERSAFEPLDLNSE